LRARNEIPSDVGYLLERARHDPKAIVFAIDARLRDLLRR